MLKQTLTIVTMVALSTTMAQALLTETFSSRLNGFRADSPGYASIVHDSSPGPGGANGWAKMTITQGAMPFAFTGLYNASSGFQGDLRAQHGDGVH